MSKKPILWGENETEFERQSKVDVTSRSRDFDPFYIPGYSELQKSNAIASADPNVLPEHVKRKYYERFGVEPAEFPFEFVWVRVASPSGQNSYNADVDAMAYAKRGYKPVEVRNTEEYEEQFGVPFPPAAHIVDGKVRQLDCALFYVDAKTARQNEAEQKSYNEWFHQENQPREGVKTRVPFEPVDADSEDQLADLPDSYRAGSTINFNR